MIGEIIFGLSISYFILFILSVALRDNSIADIFWGLGFLQVTIHALIESQTRSPAQIILFVIILAWSTRIVFYIVAKKTRVEDRRYREWREQWKYVHLRSFFQIYVLQAALLLVIAIPIFMINISPQVSWFFLLGSVIAFGGLIYETAADIQLRRFVKRKKKGEFMQQGLWKYSRHPNYFGESVFWLGISLMAFNVSAIALISWLTITLLLRFVSGVPLAEKRYLHDKQFQRYRRKTPAMIPRLR
ncbi:MAG: DUF1295 domain-containing protein [Candidatus Woesearchaeota archaeon]